MFRFPWGDFHSLNLGWFLQKFNELREDWATAAAGIDGALDAEIQKAEDALSDVFAARDAAAASASAANSSALNASQSSIASMDARDQSRAARDAAQQAATNAAGSETAAGNSATAASNSAGAAATSATQAGNSATAAQNSAAAAANSATGAGNSASAAANSASAAEQSASDAEDAAASVETSREQIATNTSNIASLNKQINALTPDIYISKNAYIQNGSLVNDRRTISIENGVIEYNVIGAVSRGFIITGENITDMTTSITSFLVTENMLNPINKLFGCNTLKVLAESDVTDPTSPAIRNIFIVYFYNVENGVCTRLNSFSVSNLTGYYINYFEIPENATHYAISVFSGNGNTVKSTFHVEFTKTDLSALAIALSN